MEVRMVKIQTNKQSQWAKKSDVSKRINGFLSYLLCAFSSLFMPIRTDMVLYKELIGQFTIIVTDDSKTKNATTQE